MFHCLKKKGGGKKKGYYLYRSLTGTAKLHIIPAPQWSAHLKRSILPLLKGLQLLWWLSKLRSLSLYTTLMKILSWRLYLFLYIYIFFSCSHQQSATHQPHVLYSYRISHKCWDSHSTQQILRSAGGSVPVSSTPSFSLGILERSAHSGEPLQRRSKKSSKHLFHALINTTGQRWGTN